MRPADPSPPPPAPGSLAREEGDGGATGHGPSQSASGLDGARAAVGSFPAVSIVLPTYNGASFLRDAIESCLGQTFADWELIVVDDASTDETPAIIGEYARLDRRIRPVRNAVNRKLPATLNVGFGYARGELLTWTSDDNMYRPEALEAMTGFLRARPDVDLVYADFTVVDQTGAPTRNGWTGPLRDLPLSDVVGACFLYRRAVHERLGGYDERLFLVEDYDFWMRASVHFKLERLQRDLYLYRSHPGSLTATRTQAIRAAHERALAQNLPQMRWVDPEVRAAAYRDMITGAMRRDERGSAWSYFLSWLRSQPKALLSEWRAVPYLLLPAALHLPAPDDSPWRWMQQSLGARRDLRRAIPEGVTCIFVDNGLLGGDLLAGRRALPFTERDGQYWGPPADDNDALSEFERLRAAGAEFIAFAWPAFWWLDHYAELGRRMRSGFRCVLQNDRLIVFDLRGEASPTKITAAAEPLPGGAVAA